jgi:hypothetical protein
MRSSTGSIWRPDQKCVAFWIEESRRGMMLETFDNRWPLTAYRFTRITVGQSTSSSSSTHSSSRAAAYHSCQAGSAIMACM